MKKTFKRITALLLVLVMAFVFIPAGTVEIAYADIASLPATFDTGTGHLEWDAYPGASYYDVFVNTEYYPYWTPDESDHYDLWVDNVINEMFADGDITWASSYEIRVIACDSADNDIAIWRGEYNFEPNVGTIQNLNLDYGMLSWDPYPGTDYYVVGADDLWTGIDTDTEISLDYFFEDNNFDSGFYDVRVEAFDGDNNILAYGVIPAYEYEAAEYGDIQNVQFKDGIMTWDPVEGVGAYYVGIDEYWNAVPGASFEIDKVLDELIANGTLDNRGTHSVSIETDSMKKYYTWSGKYTHYYNNTEVDTVFRYFGSTRFETSLKVAKAYKEKIGLDKLTSVVLACGNNYADALAGSYLSDATKGPIILVDSVQSHIDAVQAFIKENLETNGTIYLLGGTAVVPDAAVAGLSGYEIKRLWGSTRYETNLEILKEGDAKAWWTPNDIIVCSGGSFADSLSAAATGARILLVKGSSLDQNQLNYLNSLAGEAPLYITIVGGEGAVPKAIATQLEGYGWVDRVGGKDRYETSKLLADYWFGNVSAAVVAYGANFPDGLCGGSLAKAMEGPLILATTGKTQYAAEYVKNYQHISYGAVLGGPALISDAAAKAIFDVSPNSNVVVVK